MYIRGVTKQGISQCKNAMMSIMEMYNINILIILHVMRLYCLNIMLSNLQIPYKLIYIERILIMVFFHGKSAPNQKSSATEVAKSSGLHRPTHFMVTYYNS